VFKVRGQLPQCLRPQRISGVLADARRGTVVGLVHDQQVVLAGVDRLAGCGECFTEEPQRAFPLEEVDAGDEAGKVCPRIDVNAPPTTKLTHQLGVHDAEVQAELVPHLVSPLNLEG